PGPGGMAVAGATQGDGKSARGRYEPTPSRRPGAELSADAESAGRKPRAWSAAPAAEFRRPVGADTDGRAGCNSADRVFHRQDEAAAVAQHSRPILRRPAGSIQTAGQWLDRGH